jgi:anti-sigma B factor antagonist
MSKFEITERKEDGVVVLDLSGDLVFGDAPAALRTQVRDCLREGTTNITLDFANTVHLDSSGIGEMISALTAVRREGGRLQLMNLSERIHWLLKIAKLTEIFEILSEEESPCD